MWISSLIITVGSNLAILDNNIVKFNSSVMNEYVVSAMARQAFRPTTSDVVMCHNLRHCPYERNTFRQ